VTTTRRAKCRVVVTADAWTNDVLASLDVRLPLTVTKEQVVHFGVNDAGRDGLGGRHAPGAFPVWIWMDDPSWYGFPTYGEATVKVGQDCGGQPVDPQTRTFDVDEEMLHGTRAFMRVLVPGAEDVVRVTTCLYTLTPDRDFVADVLPGHESVVVGLGAAHGFKFAPWFGRVLADLATSGSSSSDVSAFGLSRRGITDPDASLSWLV
jgi:sarcosine oxidase